MRETFEVSSEEKDIAEVLASLPCEQLDASRDICAICHQTMAEGEIVCYLPCGHFYHVGCIDAWLRIRTTCPLDNREIRSKDIHMKQMCDAIDEATVCIHICIKYNMCALMIFAIMIEDLDRVGICFAESLDTDSFLRQRRLKWRSADGAGWIRDFPTTQLEIQKSIRNQKLVQNYFIIHNNSSRIIGYIWIHPFFWGVLKFDQCKDIGRLLCLKHEPLGRGDGYQVNSFEVTLVMYYVQRIPNGFV